MLEILLVVLFLSTPSVNPWYQHYLSQMSHETIETIKQTAKDISLTRSSTVQAGLLDEDLHWQYSGLTKEQRLLIVTITMNIAIERADKEIEKLVKSGLDKPNNPKMKLFAFMLNFRAKAEELVKHNREVIDNYHWQRSDFQFLLSEK